MSEAGESAKLAKGIEVFITDDGSELVVHSGGAELFRLQAPDHASFSAFERHVSHGMCPIVSFDPGHQINGWMDWYYHVDIDRQSMTRLNPWK